ncbi:MAG: hypothetical protein QM723_06940 [Myxococcaceae bacterium]
MIERALTLGLLLAGSFAWAQEDAPYVRTTIENLDGGADLCLAWSHRDFNYSLDSAGSSKTPGNSEFIAIDQAIATWRALSDGCSDFVYTDLGLVDMPQVGQGTEDSNVIVFRETACRDVVPQDDNCLADGSCINLYRCWDHGDLTIALTTTTYSIRTGIIYDADIELNAAPHLDGTTFLFTTVDAPPCPIDQQSPSCVATDIQNTITHEFGHAMGFDHTLYPNSTMNPTAPVGETSKRIIDLGTAQGFCSVYPKGQPPLSCSEVGSLQRRIIADNQGTPGLTAIGCSAVGPISLAAIALLLPLIRRRRTR